MVEVPKNTVLGILDKALRDAKLQPEYSTQDFRNEKTNQMQTGVQISTIKTNKIDLLRKYSPENLHKLGILGFVNGEEPDQGRTCLSKVVPKENDTLSLAIIEQGTYKGNFRDSLKGKEVVGLQPVLNYKVTAEDLKNTDPIKI